jgi:hypothetical protein
VDPNNPMTYLETVLYPKMQSVFSNLECAHKLKYGGETELFPDILPSTSDISELCANNYFVINEAALMWANGTVNGGQSVCIDWDAGSTCQIRTNNTMPTDD